MDDKIAGAGNVAVSGSLAVSDKREVAAGPPAEIVDLDPADHVLAASDRIAAEQDRTDETSRATAALARDEAAEARDEAAAGSGDHMLAAGDRVAAELDRTEATSRARDAIARDVAAVARDVAAQARDVASADSGDPNLADEDRLLAAADRVLAARDRKAAALDRLASTSARNAALARDIAAEARDVASTDADDHILAARDRRAAALDRQEATTAANAALARDVAAEARDAASVDSLQNNHRDQLTGTLSRDAGHDQLSQILDRAYRDHGPLVIAFVDVDHLKEMNDTQGHGAGDRLLRAVGSALRQSLRSYDVVVRYGGDEFVCALPGALLGEADRRFTDVGIVLASRIEGASFSVGLAEFTGTETLEQLIARADHDMYQARVVVRAISAQR